MISPKVLNHSVPQFVFCRIELIIIGSFYKASVRMKSSQFSGRIQGVAQLSADGRRHLVNQEGQPQEGSLEL